jgi:DNA-binding winged helix-turn-helix (wHTH) protein/TolB-like protein
MKQIYEFGDFRADPAEQLLVQDGRPVPLPPKVFETLLILLESEGRLIDKDEFIGQLWPDVFVEDGTLTQNISSLRKILGDGKNGAQMIQTVPKRGYRFAAPVRRILDQPAEPQYKISVIAAQTSGIDPKVNTKKLGFAVLLAAVVIALAALGLRAFWGRQARNIHSVAVLPFINAGNDKSLDYLSDGLAELVIDNLSQVPNLRVVSQGSSARFGFSHTDPRSAGKTLGVQSVLTGRVLRHGDSIVIHAEMLDVSDGRQIWGEQYTYKASDLSRLQTDLTTSIASKLRLSLTPEERAHIAKRPTEDSEAYRLYLQGQYYANQNIPGSLRRSIDSFAQATEKDPNFALAYVGLANDYNVSDLVGIASARESYPKAKAAATRAITLDPLLADAHTALAMEESRYEFNWDGAGREFARAVQLNPNSVDALRFYAGDYLTPMLRHREAIAAMKKAVEFEPLSLPANFGLAFTYHLGGELEHAEQQYRHVMDLAPNFPSPHLFLSNVLNAQGRYEDSIAELEKGLIMAGESPHEAARQTGALSVAFQSAGGRGYWRKYVDLGLEAVNQPSHFWFGDWTFIAQGYAESGDNDKAMEWLNKSYEEREGCLLPGLNSLPGFRNLHGDPRFSELLHRMGMPE